MRRLLVVDPLSAPNLALRSDLVMFNLLECKYNRNASRNRLYKLQILGFLWFSSQKLTLCSYSRFFSLLSSVFSPATLSNSLPIQNGQPPLLSLSSLFKQPLIPFPPKQHPLTHPLSAHQPPPLPPLCPPLSNIDVGVGWW